jgi:hypothetical protein
MGIGGNAYAITGAAGTIQGGHDARRKTMGDIIEIARTMADRFTINHVVIASLGEGARRTAEVFGTDRFHIHAIGNIGHAAGKEAEERIAALKHRGVRVHLLPPSVFQALSNGWEWSSGEKTYSFGGDDFYGLTLEQLIDKAKADPYGGVFHVLYQALQSPFSDGPRMCIEIALMAADAGVVPTDEDIITIDRPLRESNCPHAAMVVRASRTVDLLRHHRFRVKELVSVPGWNDKWFNNGRPWSG